MTPKFQVENATIYRANGRRWFTLNAAARAEGREKLRPWFKQAQSDWERIPEDLLSRYWKAVDYLARRAKRRWQNERGPRLGAASQVSGQNLADAHSKSPDQSERLAVPCPHAPTYDAGLCCGHPDDCTFVSPAALAPIGEAGR